MQLKNNVCIEKIEELLEKTFIAGIEGRLRINGAHFVISNENDIVQFTHLSGGTTLLKTLGYSNSTAQDHPVKITWGVNTISPDYGLVINGQHVAIIDVKSPRVKIDNYSHQILSYCREYKCPIGVLFNGKSVRLYVNTPLIPRSQHKLLFESQPVFSADVTILTNELSNEEQKMIRRNEIHKMAKILCMICKPSLQQDAISYARNLIRLRKSEIDLEENEKIKLDKIRTRLTKIKATPSNQVLQAIKQADARLKELKPTKEQLKNLW